MENIKTIAFRGSSDLIGNLQLCIDHISYAIPNIMNSVSGQYNVDCSLQIEIYLNIELILIYKESLI